MRYLSLLFGVALLLVTSGCATTQPPHDPALSIDSLRSENAILRSRLRQLEDSLQLHDDVETGQYDRNLRTLKDQLNRLTYETRSLRQGGQTVTVLPTDSLFEPATATPTAVGVERLQEIARHLETTYPNRTIRVEGHADDTPLSEELQEQYPSNWELSCFRAAAVVRQLIAYSDLAPNQFVVIGYGATQPVASNETATGRRRNRRVRVAVLPSPRDYSRPFETAW